MKRNPIDEGRFTNNGRGLGTVTRGMVMERARQIAFINGRSSKNVLDSDVLEARRELQGEDELNPTPTRLESLPEAKRWLPVAESEGHKAYTVPVPDEQTFAERLVDEGIADAELEQEIQATRDALRREMQ
jgi:hypothetical protein